MVFGKEKLEETQDFALRLAGPCLPAGRQAVCQSISAEANSPLFFLVL